MDNKKTPSPDHMQEQMDALSILLETNPQFLQMIGFDDEKAEEIRGRIQEAEDQLKELTHYPKRFNELFSADGWLAHDSVDFEFLKRAVDTCEGQGAASATKLLLDYYGAGQVAERVFLLKRAKELRVRGRFIDLALADHAAGRHYSAIPLLLMIMDGAINDAVGKGLHASDLDLDVWDSLMTADGAIYRIKQVFQHGRYKTRSEPIDLPYRNGILHGMDLGYDTPLVTAKCWCFLFVVCDWILSKSSEGERKKAFAKEIAVPSLEELHKDLAEISRLKEATRAWTRRSIERSYLESLTIPADAERGSPEATVLEYLLLWQSRNFGGMARMFCDMMTRGTKLFVRELRWQFEDAIVSDYSVTRIVDEAPALAGVDVLVASGDGCQQSARWNFQLIRENSEGNPVPVNMEGGRWRILSARTQES